MRSVGISVVLLCAACRAGNLAGVPGTLEFSVPEDPSALVEPDAGVVRIDFGEVTVDGAKTLTVDLSSLAGLVTLGSTSATQPDAEFTLPLVSGTEVGTAPVAVQATFTPSSSGTKNAVFDLAYTTPLSGAVVIELTGQGVRSGLVVTPNPVDFGIVELNQVHSVTFHIANQSPLAAALTLSGLHGANTAPFTLGTPAATELAPGASTTMTAAFAPLTAETDSASFTIDGWATTHPLTVNLTGIGAQTLLEASPLLNFNYVQVDHSLAKSALLTNRSSYETLHLVAPGPVVTGPEFSLAPAGNLPLPYAIAPGESVPIPVQFAPYGLGPTTGQLSLATDDPLDEQVFVSLEGYGGGPAIFCEPELVFEPAMVGIPQTLQTDCVNAGTDIPGHPEITLQISPSDVSVDNPAFTAVLVKSSDGGAIRGDAGVALTQGESALIEVTFLPADAGPVFAKLTVSSNDLNDADAGTLVSGVGTVPGPCTLQVIPSALSFGEVPQGDVGKMQFELANVGQDYCLLEGVALDRTSDPAFALLVGLPGRQMLSFPGNEGLPSGLPDSLVFEAQFAPTASNAQSVGTVEVGAADTARISIPLSGTSLAGCLGIQPPSYDFGLVRCTNPVKTFWATNLCASPLTLSQVALAPGPYDPPEFTVTSGATLPVTLAGGQGISFIAGFDPGPIGPKVGGIQVSSSDLPGTPYLVTLEGDTELSGTHTDTFTVPTPIQKVDVAWILDNDDDGQSNFLLQSLVPQLTAAMDQSGIDYRIAVTSTDTCSANGSDQGAFEPCAHCLSQLDAGATYIVPGTLPDPGTGLQALFNVFQQPQLPDCESLNGDEHLFDAIADTFSPALLGGHNAGFLRPDAYLAILMANGDDEDDGANLGAPPVDLSDYLTSLPSAVSLVEGLKSQPSQVSFSYVYSGPGSPPTLMGELIELTGGLAVNSGGPNWQAQLVDLFSSGVQGQALFTLSGTPRDPAAIQVEVNGVPTTDWVLDGNAIDLTGTPPPAPGSIVTVTYQPGC